MYWDRFDICEAWFLALTDCHGGQYSRAYAKLCGMRRYFTPSPYLSIDSLSENGLQIYDDACTKLLGE